MTSVGALRAKAAEIRQLAETSKDTGIKTQLTHLAEQFERLAQQAERGIGPLPISTSPPTAQRALA